MYIVWPCIGFISNILLWRAISIMGGDEQQNSDHVLWKEHYKAIGIIIGTTIAICAAIFGFIYTYNYTHMVELKNAEISFLSRKVADLEKQISNYNQTATPSQQGVEQQLLFKTSVIQKLQSSYQAVLTFVFSKNEHPGKVELTATIQEPSQSRIIKFWPIVDHLFTRNKDHEIIATDGKSAILKYQPSGVFDIHLDLEITMPAYVLIEGSHDLQSFTVGMK